MKKSFFTLLLIVLMSMVGTKALAYDIAVENTDGVTIYYNYINDGKELEITYRNEKYNSYNGSVVIPEEVTYMDTYLKVTSIGYQAFYNCRSLISITIPNSVTTIGNSAFSSCSGLTSITIPNSVTTIGDWAFFFCYGLTSITIPNSVTSIGKYAFSSCSGLTSIKVEDGNKNYNSRDNCNAIIETESNTLLAGCKNTIIPNNVTSIGDKAFGYCTGLTSITIPNSVTSIGEDAFNGCSGLTFITIPNSVTSIDGFAFSNCSGLTSITIPNSVTSIEKYAFNFCYGLTSVTIPNSVTSIGYSAFYGCSGLTSITIPNSVTSIGEYAFYNCSGLTSITIPNSVTSIGISAFYSTGWYNNQPDGLVYAGKVAYKYKGTMPDNTSITIKDGTQMILADAFDGCSGLTSITIPNSVTSIDGFAFSGCSGLTSITIPNSVTSIGDWAFSNCTGLTSITIPNSVTSIGEFAFTDCSGLTSVTIPNSVTSIGDQAFSGCSGLTSITIPNSVTSIGEGVFGGCRSLTSITIPNSVTSIGDQTFVYCSSLTSIMIPNSVTSIGYSAFYGCSGLTSIMIPSSVTSIGNSAFYNCSGLNSIKSLNDAPSTLVQDNYGSYTQFDLVDKTSCVVWVPKGSVNAYKEADGWKDFQNIRELAYGDVNIDFEVNQADLDATTDFIVDKAPEGFYENLADLNGDDKVNAADVVKLVTILNIQDGLSLDYQANYSNQVISSLSCTLNNDGDKAIQLTKCELYYNQSLVSSANFKMTLASGGSKKCSFDDLASLSSKTGFSLVWYYTYNGEDYTYRYDLSE